LAGLIGSMLDAQTPRPFPQPSQPQPAQPAQPAPPSPSRPGASQPARPQGSSAPATPAGSDVPSEATLGVAIYPSAQYITSYDAGRGQRFYLFGAAVPFLDMVNYYRAALKQKGSELFESPATHQFDIGRFRDEIMAFPPSVTLKDYTWGGSAGYPNPKLGGQPRHFATIIQIVPMPRGTNP
jgi:hypothetical protein